MESKLLTVGCNRIKFSIIITLLVQGVDSFAPVGSLSKLYFLLLLILLLLLLCLPSYIFPNLRPFLFVLFGTLFCWVVDWSWCSLSLHSPIAKIPLILHEQVYNHLVIGFRFPFGEDVLSRVAFQILLFVCWSKPDPLDRVIDLFFGSPVSPLNTLTHMEELVFGKSFTSLLACWLRPIMG